MSVKKNKEQIEIEKEIEKEIKREHLQFYEETKLQKKKAIIALEAKLSKEALEWEISILESFKKKAIEALEKVDSMENSVEHFGSTLSDLMKEYVSLQRYVELGLQKSKGF